MESADEDSCSSISSNKSEHEDEETFEDILSLIPSRPHSLFPFQSREAQHHDHLEPLEVRRRIFQQILDFIPPSQIPTELPDTSWFDCTKPLLKLCQSSMRFVNHLGTALENLGVIKEELFSIVDQYPDTGDLNVLSSLLILLMELLSQIPWSGLTKKVEKRVKEDIEVILVYFKKLTVRMLKIEELCRDLVKKCEHIFEKAPSIHGMLPRRSLAAVTHQHIGK